MRISFYFDPICPWCWTTARWLIEVRESRDISIDWRTFSLAIKNQDLAGQDRWRAAQEEGLRALRLVEVARAVSGPDVVEDLYKAMADQWHAQKERTFDLDLVLKAAGVESVSAAVADDVAWNELIESSMAGAMAIVGEDVGVPLVVFEGSEPAGFFGPIMSPAPTGEDAAVAFDHLLGLASIPGFYELKRSRT